MIGVINSNMGNPQSIVNMLESLGIQSYMITSKSDFINETTRIILPGVGAFDHGVAQLRERGLVGLLEKKVLDERMPFLGICLGMQLLFQDSEEGVLSGLGWISGRVKKFDKNLKERGRLIRVPHMGWNRVTPVHGSSYFQEEESRFYFVHSYHADEVKAEYILATTTYGQKFVSAVKKDNILGVQFHPEKSHRYGKIFLKKFAEGNLC